MTEALFSKFTAGGIAMSNRIVMAPLTRNRADDEDGTVNDLHVEYYRQRAGAGLIITEGTTVTRESTGWFLHGSVGSPSWQRVLKTLSYTVFL